MFAPDIQQLIVTGSQRTNKNGCHPILLVITEYVTGQRTGLSTPSYENIFFNSTVHSLP
jgi:hypothetical protein